MSFESLRFGSLLGASPELLSLVLGAPSSFSELQATTPSRAPVVLCGPAKKSSWQVWERSGLGR